jgi:hypothetical protein
MFQFEQQTKSQINIGFLLQKKKSHSRFADEETLQSNGRLENDCCGQRDAAGSKQLCPIEEHSKCGLNQSTLACGRAELQCATVFRLESSLSPLGPRFVAEANMLRGYHAEPQRALQ